MSGHNEILFLIGFLSKYEGERISYEVDIFSLSWSVVYIYSTENVELLHFPFCNKTKSNADQPARIRTNQAASNIVRKANPIRMESPRSVGSDFEYRNLHFKV
jgi:hypothetical protein